MFAAVFEDEVALRMQQAHHAVRQGFNALQGIGRIRENDVETFLADGQEIKDVLVHRYHGIQPQAGGFAADEQGVVTRHFNAIYARRTA